jgi:hypothetical protein
VTGRRTVALVAAAALSIACGKSSRHSSSSAGGSNAGGGDAGGNRAGGEVVEAGGNVSAAGMSGASTALGGAGAAGTPAEPVEPYEGTTTEYWAQVVDTELARQQECFGIPSDYGMLNSNVVSAHYLVEKELRQRLRYVQPSIDAKRVRFDLQVAAECLERMVTQSCEELLLDVARGDRCVDDALIGLVPLGGACEQAIDCSSRDQFCYGPPDAPRVCTLLSRPGQPCDFIGCTRDSECVQTRPDPLETPAFTCVAKPPAGEGEPCSFGGCAQGLFCLNQVCHSYHPGASCASNTDCVYLEVCLFDPTGEHGHCGRPRAEGESCGGNSLENDCAFSFDCRADTQGRVACTSVWAPIGALCRNTGVNGGIVCIDGYCDVVSSSNQQGVCVAAHQLGDECFVGSCAPGLECSEAGCQPESF